MNSNYYSALKISLIFLVISSLYIVFSDKIILQILGDSASVEILNKIQSYKGVGFVFLTSILLFVLIQREIASRMKYIQELEEQQLRLKYLSDEKEKVSEELAERNQYIQTILNNIPLGVAVNRLNEGNAIYLNKQFENIYGWPKEELIDVSNFFKRVYPDEEYREKIQQRIMGNIKSSDAKRMHWENIEITTQTGEKKIINARNIPLAEQNLMISTVQDVTERVKLQKERDRIFENSVDMVATGTMDGYFLQLNPAWEKTLGWTPEELKSKPFFEFIHPDDLASTIEATKNLEKGEPTLGFENRYLAKDSSYRWLSWNTIPFPEENILMGIARDITRHKEIQNKLEQSEKNLKQALKEVERNISILNQTGKLAKVGGWELDLETMTPYFSEETFRIYGLPVGVTPEVEDGINFYAPEARPVIQKAVSEAIENHKPYDVELPFITAKGKNIWVRSMGKVEVKNGKAVRLFGAIQDITKMREFTARIEESEIKYKTIFESIPSGITVSDNTGKIIESNAFSENLLGLKVEEHKERKIDSSEWKILRSDGSEMPPDEFAAVRALKENRLIDNMQMGIVKSNNEITWINVNAIPIPLENYGVVVTYNDITFRKKAEEDLFESNALLEKTINSLNEAVLVINPENRKITLANKAVEKIFGYKVSEVIGINTEFLHVNPIMYKKFATVGDPKLEKKGTFHIEFQMKRKDGSVIDTENTVTAIRDEKGWYSGVVSVIRDVTEQKQTERRLHEYQESLKQLTTELSIVEEKQRKEFAANIHDHLSQLLVISQMKMNDLKKQLLSDEKKQLLEIVSKHIAEALENSRKITYDLSPPVLYELGLVETMYWFTDKINEEQDIHAKFTSNVESVSLSESKLILLFRVIQELVNNTLKHAQANYVHIQFIAEPNSLKITVKDDGEGFHINGSVDTKFKKGGFGLFAVKERINNLGGEFFIQSKPGIGTTVIIILSLTDNNSE